MTPRKPPLLYVLYTWLIFIPLLALLTALFGAFAILLSVLGYAHLAGRWAGRNWARLLALLTPMRVTVHGREHIDAKQSYIIVVNHQSNYDILVLYGWLDIDIKWVMKEEIHKIPVIGYSCEKMGHIFIDRRNTEKALHALEKAKRRIVDGVSVIFFPEGTRSLDGKLLPFKKGAFRLAQDLGLPVLPITLVGTRDILPARSLALMPGHARMIIHPPIPAPDKTPAALPELMKTARERIASALPE